MIKIGYLKSETCNRNGCKGITKAAKEANGRSQRCNPEVSRACSDNFVEGFKKGVAWLQKQMKEEQQ